MLGFDYAQRASKPVRFLRIYIHRGENKKRSSNDEDRTPSGRAEPPKRNHEQPIGLGEKGEIQPAINIALH